MTLEQRVEKRFKKWTGHSLSAMEKDAIFNNKACIENIECAADVFAPGKQQIKAEWIIELANTLEPCRRESYVEWLIHEKFDWDKYERQFG